MMKVKAHASCRGEDKMRRARRVRESETRRGVSTTAISEDGHIFILSLIRLREMKHMSDIKKCWAEQRHHTEGRHSGHRGRAQKTDEVETLPF